MKKELGYSYNIKLQSITPVHIGSGNYLSSKSSLLNYGQEIIDKRQVTTAKPMEISEFVKSNNRVFIPGSSLKGAIRTALLHDWLKVEGAEKLKQWLYEMQEIINDKKINFKKKAEVIHKGSRDKQYLGFSNIIENFCFGNFRNMGNLKITDSDFIADTKTLIYELKRYFLTSNYKGIPTFHECILPNVEVNFRLNVDYLYKDQQNKEVFFQLINKHCSSTENIVKLLNSHSKALLEYEQSIFDEEEIINEEIGGYKQTIDLLIKEISTDNKTAIVRLGAGKMQFHQTIALSILNLNGMDKDEEDWITDCWENYKEYLKNFEVQNVEFPYPKTRALTVNGQLPLGWVKLIF